jgi:hypothetical protein
MRLKRCGKNIAGVLLLGFLMNCPAHGGQPMRESKDFTTGGKNSYSAGEVEALIDELTETAKGEIEKAAAEAAKAAALASVEREAAVIAEAQRWRREYEDAKRDGIKNMLLAGALCLIGGFALGAETMMYGGMR